MNINAAQLAKLVANKYHTSRTGKHSFSTQLEGLAHTPLVYEDADLLDYAMRVLPLDRLYKKADEDYRADKSFGEQDYVVKEMLKYAPVLLNHQLQLIIS